MKRADRRAKFGGTLMTIMDPTESNLRASFSGWRTVPGEKELALMIEAAAGVM